jgi:hypothetical protein
LLLTFQTETQPLLKNLDVGTANQPVRLSGPGLFGEAEMLIRARVSIP